MSTTLKMIGFAGPFRLPSPMAMLRSLHARLIAADGPRMENEIMIEQVDRETTEVTACTAEAQQMEARLQKFSEELKADLTDKKSPGIIDATEARHLARTLLGAKAKAHQHTTHLKTLL